VPPYQHHLDPVDRLDLAALIDRNSRIGAFAILDRDVMPKRRSIRPLHQKIGSVGDSAWQPEGWLTDKPLDEPAAARELQFLVPVGLKLRVEWPSVYDDAPIAVLIDLLFALDGAKVLNRHALGHLRRRSAKFHSQPAGTLPARSQLLRRCGLMPSLSATAFCDLSLTTAASIAFMVMGANHIYK
jgi:hypothetical protein